MGLSRRFLNLIVKSHKAAARSLRRIDLKSQRLFYTTPPPPPPAPIRRPTTTMDSILLPDPILKFGAHSLRGAGEPCDLACYPFGQRKVLSTDQAGRNLLYDASSRDVAVMPEFRKPKLRGCLSLFVPSGDGEDDHVEEEGEDDHEEEGEVDAKDEREGGGAGSLYLMVRHLREVESFNIAAGQPSMDFEVLFYGNGKTTSHCKLLPLPPFVLEPIHPNEHPEIRSYAVVGGSSQICVSVDGRGTYTLDTASHTWDKVGDWTLPFHGKVEYVPELKLWFGLSGDAQHLAAADLSTMDAHSPPQLAAGHGWEEFQPPEEWAEQELEIDREGVQLVNLGSGRFCMLD
ncbi:uncharacterized protein [Miscanthus floridulus]|uniref:uncharacterized protein n=1 Tax=Miscanthus floridulus TaxID=154761 RepID=UPI00345817DC